MQRSAHSLILSLYKHSLLLDELCVQRNTKCSVSMSHPQGGCYFNTHFKKNLKRETPAWLLSASIYFQQSPFGLQEVLSERTWGVLPGTQHGVVGAGLRHSSGGYAVSVTHLWWKIMGILNCSHLFSSGCIYLTFDIFFFPPPHILPTLFPPEQIKSSVTLVWHSCWSKLHVTVAFS